MNLSCGTSLQLEGKAPVPKPLSLAKAKHPIARAMRPLPHKGCSLMCTLVSALMRVVELPRRCTSHVLLQESSRKATCEVAAPWARAVGVALNSLGAE